MSTLLSKRPISVVIFDRTQAGFSDVPVFAQKLKEKVNTPITREISDSQLSPIALKILGEIQKKEASVLCADSSGGQTGEFAQSTESERTQSPTFSVQGIETAKQEIREIAEDPALDRTLFESIGLDEILHELHSVAPKIPALKLSPYNPSLLHESNTHGYLDRVVLPSTQFSLVSNCIETLLFELRKVTRKVRAVSVPQLPTIVLPPIDDLSALIRLPEFDFARLASKILIAGSLVLMLMTVGPMIALEVQSYRQKISNAVVALPTRAEETKPTPIPSANPDPDKQFQIVIPKIGVNSKVQANIDPGNEEAYSDALKTGVAHAAGTGLPGEANTENKTIFIFGHSTNGEWNIARYNALFYALKDLIVNDTFSVWFWGREYHYKVTKTEIVAAEDVSFLIPQTSKDQLILQTCWPPGTSWKRFLIIAEPEK